MDVKKMMRAVIHKLSRYRYPLLILMLGIVLMCIPFGDKETIDQGKETTEVSPSEIFTLQEEMETILSHVEGAGEVRVLLSPQTGFTHTYHQDLQIKTQSDSSESVTQTILVSNNGEELPIEIKADYPTYRGALVLCRGADRASVKLAIIQAVSNLTGLKSDQISVIKMTSE